MRRSLLAAFVGLMLATPAFADGVLKIAVGVNLNTLDPARTTLGEEYIYDNLVFNGLVRMTAAMKIEPGPRGELGYLRRPQELDLPSAQGRQIS